LVQLPSLSSKARADADQALHLAQAWKTRNVARVQATTGQAVQLTNVEIARANSVAGLNNIYEIAALGAAVAECH
jgi:hypothetical protein